MPQDFEKQVDRSSSSNSYNPQSGATELGDQKSANISQEGVDVGLNKGEVTGDLDKINQQLESQPADQTGYNAGGETGDSGAGPAAQEPQNPVSDHNQPQSEQSQPNEPMEGPQQSESGQDQPPENQPQDNIGREENGQQEENKDQDNNQEELKKEEEPEEKPAEGEGDGGSDVPAEEPEVGAPTPEEGVGEAAEGAEAGVAEGAGMEAGLGAEGAGEVGAGLEAGAAESAMAGSELAIGAGLPPVALAEGGAATGAAAAGTAGATAAAGAAAGAEAAAATTAAAATAPVAWPVWLIAIAIILGIGLIVIIAVVITSIISISSTDTSTSANQAIVSQVESAVLAKKLELTNSTDLDKIKQGEIAAPALKAIASLSKKHENIKINYNLDDSGGTTTTTSATPQNNPYEFDVAAVDKIKCTNTASDTKNTEIAISLEKNFDWAKIIPANTSDSILCAVGYYPQLDAVKNGAFAASFGPGEFRLKDLAAAGPKAAQEKTAELTDEIIAMRDDLQIDPSGEAAAVPIQITVGENFFPAINTALTDKIAAASTDPDAAIILASTTNQFYDFHLSFFQSQTK